MRVVLALLLFGHGIAHLVGFVVPWRLIENAAMPYRTTIVGGSVDLGETGIRIYACGWLLLAVAFAVLAAGLMFRAPWWYRGVLVTVGVSTLFTVLSLPESRIGLVTNVFILVATVAGAHFGWLDVGPG